MIFSFSSFSSFSLYLLVDRIIFVFFPGLEGEREREREREREKTGREVLLLFSLSCAK